MTVTNTGKGCACHPVEPPAAYSCRRTTTSIGSFDWALNFAWPSGFDITLKLSYVPLANTVAFTPEGGDAIAMVPAPTSSARAATAATVSDLVRRMGLSPSPLPNSSESRFRNPCDRTDLRSVQHPYKYRTWLSEREL